MLQRKEKWCPTKNREQKWPSQCVHILLHFVICHSKKCHRPCTSSCHKIHQGGTEYGLYSGMHDNIRSFPLSRKLCFDPGVFGRSDLVAMVQPHLDFLFVCPYPNHFYPTLL